MTISPIYIITITPSILKHLMGGLISFFNFLGPKKNQFGSTTSFKNILPIQNFKNFESSPDTFTE